MRRSRVAGAVIAGCLLGMSVAPDIDAATPSCQVRNVTQETRGDVLRSMVRAADAGDRLWVRGTCVGNVIIGRDLVIKGRGDHAVVTGLDRYRAFRVRKGATVTLRNLIIERVVGVYDGTRGGGGGIYNEGIVTLADSIVRRAKAGEDPGGAIANHGLMTIRDTVIRRSRADWGGGIGNLGTLTLVGSHVAANHPEGIWSRGPMTIADSVVRDNAWGGIFVGGKVEVTISGSRVEDNRRGGGIEKSGGGTLTLDGCLIAGNTALQDGGGIETRWGQLALVATTVKGNTAGRHGGGIFVTDGSTNVTLDTSSSVRDNSPDDCFGTPVC